MFLGTSAERSSATKRKRIIRPVESDSNTSSDSDDEPDNEEVIEHNSGTSSSYRIPNKGKRIWDSKQIANLRKNF